MAPRKATLRAMTDEQLLGALILDRSNASVYCGEILHRHGMGNLLFKTYIESYNKYCSRCNRQEATDNPVRAPFILLLLLKHIIEDKRHYAATVDSLINKLRSCLPDFRNIMSSTISDNKLVEMAKRVADNKIWNERAAFFYMEYMKSGGAHTGSMLLWDVLINTDESVPNEKIFADYLASKEGKRA